MENQPRTDNISVKIYTDKFKIDGYIHLLYKDSYRGRLSDHLNSSRSPSFFPITRAKVFNRDEKLIFETDCIIVNKNHIEAVVEQYK